MSEIAIVLPKEEYFSPQNAGALAVWVSEVYPLIDENNFLLFCRKSDSYLENTISIAGININLIDRLSKFFAFISILAFHITNNAFPAIAAFRCRIRGIKLVHIHNRPTYAIIFKKICPNARVILHMHNDHIVHSSDVLIKSIVSSTETIICVSDYIKRGIQNRLNEVLDTIPFRLEVIHNGVNLDKFKTKTVNNFTKIKILYVGRFIKEKGVKELVGAFLSSKYLIQNCQLDIVGGFHFGDPQVSDYMKEVHEMAQYNQEVVFHGLVSHADVQNIVSCCDIMVIPSVWEEPFGLTVLEGMASSKAVLGSDRGAIPSIIGDGGLIVDPEDIVRFSDCLEILAKDNDLRIQLGKVARLRIENQFTWGHVATDVSSLLNSCLQNV